MHSPRFLTPTSVDPVVADTLRLIQERAPDIINAIDDGVYCLDAQGRTIFVNEAASRLLGYTNREILGKSMYELTHHHYADGSVFPASEFPIRSSATDAVQHRVGGDTFWTKAGKPLPVDYTSIPIKDGRAVVAVVVTFRDISDQQRVEEQALRLKREHEALSDAERAREALRESEARYRFMAESIPARWSDSLATGEPYKVEFRLRAADGSYRWHLAGALPRRDESGNIVRWFSSNTDIEEQKLAQPQ